MAVVKRWPIKRGFKQESMYGFFVRLDEKKWPLVEVRLYHLFCAFQKVKINVTIKYLTIKNCDKTFLKIILRLKNC